MKEGALKNGCVLNCCCFCCYCGSASVVFSPVAPPATTSPKPTQPRRTLLFARPSTTLQMYIQSLLKKKLPRAKHRHSKSQNSKLPTTVTLAKTETPKNKSVYLIQHQRSNNKKKQVNPSRQPDTYSTCTSTCALCRVSCAETRKRQSGPTDSIRPPKKRSKTNRNTFLSFCQGISKRKRSKQTQRHVIPRMLLSRAPLICKKRR
ncbi:hypothetical protein HDK77DRAFT_270682 [Phyllosticta capitalensis]